MSAHLTAYPLGFPVRFDVGDAAEAVLRYIQSWWGASPQGFSGPELCFQLECHAGSPPSGSVLFSETDDELTFSCDPDHVARFNMARREGLIRISHTAWAQHADWLRYHLFDAALLTALDCVAFDPIHAACVSHNGKGVLLCGGSGAGKTTLAYACARRGWTVVSEDGVHLARAGGQWQGGFWRFRLRGPSRDLFPEIANLPEVPMPNGKLAIPVDAAQQGMEVAWSCQPGPVVFLRRGPGAARLSEADRDAALAYCLEHARDPNREAVVARMQAVLDRGCWDLHYSDLDEAVGLLEGLA